MHDAEFWIRELKLKPHPEGGCYAEFYESAEEFLIPRGRRLASTSIYFLLEHPDFSAFHRLQADEIWHFYTGGPLTLWVIDPSGQLLTLRLGSDPGQGQSFQVVVPQNCWFAAQPDTPGTYTLVGCTMAPGFDYSDFELADQAELSTAYPQHKVLIERLTR